MNSFIQIMRLYAGFIISGILTLLILIVLFFGDEIFSVEDAAKNRKGIRFFSLAWQRDAVSAVNEMVEEWNEKNPDIPVELIQGTWNSVHDYLITGFETGDIPDVFHYESAIIVDFALRGYLADLSDVIDEEMKADILDVAWDSVTRSSGEVIGIPFIAESFIVLYNKRHFREAGIELPAGKETWGWDDLRSIAGRLTVDRDGDGTTDQWGCGMGLRNAANLIMNHSIAFGGSYFYEDENGDPEVRITESEKIFLEHILEMLYADKTMIPSSTGLSSSGLIPGFLSGKFSMIVGTGSWARQQLAENADSSFSWGVLPPFSAKNDRSGVNTQTFSIPKGSLHREDAVKFIQFITGRENMARLAYSDWMLPTRESCLEMSRFRSSENGWDIVAEGAAALSTGEWVGLPGYTEWKSRVANPVFQELFSGRISLNQAAARIEKESATIMKRYQLKGAKW